MLKTEAEDNKIVSGQFPPPSRQVRDWLGLGLLIGGQIIQGGIVTEPKKIHFYAGI